jgi:hypothetical protein
MSFKPPPKIFKLLDSIHSKNESIEHLEKHILASPQDTFLVFGGMSVYAYAASLSLPLLQSVHETFMKVNQKEYKDPPWNVKGDMGFTALHYTVEFNLVDELQYLVQFADVNSLDAKLNNPLILACMYNRVDIFKILTNVPNIDVNAVNADGKTALYIAASDNYIDMARKLLQKGALLEYTVNLYKHRINVNIPHKTRMFTNDKMKQLLNKSARNPRKIKKKMKESIKKQQKKSGFRLQYESLCKNLQDDSNKELIEIFANKLQIKTQGKSKSEICQTIANRAFLQIAHPTAFHDS